MNLSQRILFTLCAFSAAAWAQSFSFGVKAGVPLTAALQDKITMGVDTLFRTYSKSKLFVAGGMIELHLPLGLSIEADALYHPLNLSQANTVIPLPLRLSSKTITSFEFPVLGKLKLPVPIPLLHPYAEAGPEFRATTGGLSHLSKDGFTMGAGVALTFLKVSIAPELRYTRWGADATAVRTLLAPPSSLNQIQLLVGVSF